MRSKAKKMDNGDWVEGFYVESSGQAFIYDNEGNAWKVDPESRCRDTGLVTLQGIRIWENDFVSYDDYCGIVCFGLYDDKHYGYYISWNNDYMLRKDIWFWSRKAGFCTKAESLHISYSGF